jgi:hypothetical protein
MSFNIDRTSEALDIIDEKLDMILSILRHEKQGPRTKAHWMELPQEYIDDIEEYISFCARNEDGRQSSYQTPKQVADGAGIPPSNRMTRCVKSYLVDYRERRVEGQGPRTFVKLF